VWFDVKSKFVFVIFFILQSVLEHPNFSLANFLGSDVIECVEIGKLEEGNNCQELHIMCVNNMIQNKYIFCSTKSYKEKHKKIFEIITVLFFH